MTQSAAVTDIGDDFTDQVRERSPIARRRRNTELMLIIMVGLITGVAYTVAALGTNAEIPPGIVVFVGILLGLLLCAHIVVRLVARGADGTILPLAALLHGIGFVMITRLDDRLAGLQATWSLVGIAAFVATLLVSSAPPTSPTVSGSSSSAARSCCCCRMVPGVGQTINGARIWVSIGPINFQPGEFAKIALAIFFAAYLAERRELIAAIDLEGRPLPPPRAALHRPDHRGVGLRRRRDGRPERDLGSSLLFFTLFVVMMWVATEKASDTSLIGAVLFGGAAYFSWSQFTHVQTRVSTSGSTRGKTRSARATRSSSRSTASPTVACSAPASAAATRARYPKRRTTSSSPRSARSSA